MSTEKFCVKCGKKFIATGREVICPSCKQAAAEEAKKAAVMRAKQASWRGESVPVRISGRASTVIRKYGEEHNMSFAESLDALLKSTAFFRAAGQAWEEITPYKSRRMKKSAQDAPQEVKTASKPQDAPQDAPQDTAGKPQEVTKAAKTSKPMASKAASKAVKTSKASKASKAAKVKV